MNGVVVEKYMLEITKYPDGRSYVKGFKMGQSMKANKQPKKVEKMEVSQKKAEVKTAFEVE